MNIKSVIHRAIMLPINILERPIKRTNWYKNCIPDMENYPGDKWYRNHLERNYDVVNVGSSSGVFCFNYEESGVKSFNWAMKPQSMEYSFKILKMYFSILRQKGIVLIPFCPFSSLSVTGKWTESAYEKYYYILDHTLIDNYDAIRKRRQHPLLTQPLASFKSLLCDIPAKDVCENMKQCDTLEDFEKDAAFWINIWKKEFNISDLNAPISIDNKMGTESRRQTVRSMIDFCIERDLQPVIVLPPLHPSLNKLLPSEFKQNYIYHFIDSVSTPGLKVLDYFDTPQFSVDEYFLNSYFMNKEGSKLFTKHILKTLQQIEDL